MWILPLALALLTSSLASAGLVDNGSGGQCVLEAEEDYVMVNGTDLSGIVLNVTDNLTYKEECYEQCCATEGCNVANFVKNGDKMLCVSLTCTEEKCVWVQNMFAFKGVIGPIPTSTGAPLPTELPIIDFGGLTVNEEIPTQIQDSTGTGTGAATGETLGTGSQSQVPAGTGAEFASGSQPETAQYAAPDQGSPTQDLAAPEAPEVVIPSLTSGTAQSLDPTSQVQDAGQQDAAGTAVNPADSLPSYQAVGGTDNNPATSQTGLPDGRTASAGETQGQPGIGAGVEWPNPPSADASGLFPAGDQNPPLGTGSQLGTGLPVDNPVTSDSSPTFQIGTGPSGAPTQQQTAQGVGEPGVDSVSGTIGAVPQPDTGLTQGVEVAQGSATDTLQPVTGQVGTATQEEPSTATAEETPSGTAVDPTQTGGNDVMGDNKDAWFGGGADPNTQGWADGATGFNPDDWTDDDHGDDDDNDDDWGDDDDDWGKDDDADDWHDDDEDDAYQKPDELFPVQPIQEQEPAAPADQPDIQSENSPWPSWPEDDDVRPLAAGGTGNIAADQDSTRPGGEEDVGDISNSQAIVGGLIGAMVVLLIMMGLIGHKCRSSKERSKYKPLREDFIPNYGDDLQYYDEEP